MEITLETKHGEVIVRNAMFDPDGTTLEEGVEIKGDEFDLIEVYGYVSVEDMTVKEVEEIIDNTL